MTNVNVGVFILDPMAFGSPLAIGRRLLQEEGPKIFATFVWAITKISVGGEALPRSSYMRRRDPNVLVCAFCHSCTILMEKNQASSGGICLHDLKIDLFYILI